MSTTSNIFFEPELAQIKKINKINNNFFLYENKEYTNKDFLFFYKNICKNNNIKLYYYINSKANNLYAIHIISPNFNYRIFSCNLYKEISNERKKECLELAKEQFVVIYNILINNDNTNLNNLNKINSLNEKEKNFLNYIFGTNWFVPFNRINCAEGIYNLCKEEINSKTILQEFKNSPFEFLARKYLTLYQYKKSNQYSDEEIYQIFYPLDNSLIKEDIEFCNDKEFIIKKIIIELIYTMYNSEVFVNMIKAYCD